MAGKPDAVRRTTLTTIPRVTKVEGHHQRRAEKEVPQRKNDEGHVIDDGAIDEWLVEEELDHRIREEQGLVEGEEDGVVAPLFHTMGAALLPTETIITPLEEVGILRIIIGAIRATVGDH